jgi:hypothetical protein
VFNELSLLCWKRTNLPVNRTLFDDFEALIAEGLKESKLLQEERP